jgi:hypothetical protein
MARGKKNTLQGKQRSSTATLPELKRTRFKKTTILASARTVLNFNGELTNPGGLVSLA